MANSVDPDQLASKPTDLDLHCLQKQGISGLSRTRVNIASSYIFVTFFSDPSSHHPITPGPRLVSNDVL